MQGARLFHRVWGIDLPGLGSSRLAAPRLKRARRDMNPLDASSGVPEWLGLRQITRYAAISERTVRSWIRAPIDPLPAVRVRGKILVRRSELDLWLERRRIKERRLDLDGIVRDVLQGLTHGY